MREIAFLEFNDIQSVSPYREAVSQYFQTFVALLQEIDESGPYFYKSAQASLEPNLWVGQATATHKEYHDTIMGLKEKWTELQRKSEQLQTTTKKQIVREELGRLEIEIRDVLKRMQKRVEQLEEVYKSFSKEQQANAQIYSAITKLHLLKSRTFEDMVKYWWMTVKE